MISSRGGCCCRNIVRKCFSCFFLAISIKDCILAFLYGKGEALAVVSFMEAVVVVSATAAFVIVEGTVLLSERYLKKRFNEGKVEGREEGKLEMWQTYMRDWERRRDEAAEHGLEFNEPPPPKPQ